MRYSPSPEPSPDYFDLAVEKAAIKPAIYEHPEFAAFIADMKALFETWRTKNSASLKGLEAGCQPKSIIQALSEDLLTHYTDKPLIDRYDIYQHLMEYWEETMQDDCYLIAADGWKAETYRVIETDKKGREKDKGWTCDLIPKPLIVARYFAEEQAAIDELNADLESATARLEEVEEEQGAEDGVFAEFEKVNKQSVSLRLKEARAAYITNTDAGAEIEVLDQWLELTNQAAELKKQLKEAEADLDAKAYAHYPKLSEAEIKTPGGGRQMVCRAGSRGSRRNGAHQPEPDRAREGTVRTLRNPAAADDRARDRTGRKSEPPS